MSDKYFVDTNVLIYAYDTQDEIKHQIANQRLRALWQSRQGILSTQVLQEFHVNATRKLKPTFSPVKIRQVLQRYLVWSIEVITPDTILFASQIQEQHILSFWDSLIIAAAYQGKANTILTEDLNHGQIIEGIHIENPFLS
jgi:predicted nucleic acid-binding protein